jgi:Mlc titration factor MtfA (ptsG expression regulator)
MFGKARRARWARVLSAEFEALRQSVLDGRHMLFSSYGASDPAEFFAVISEVFFEQPGSLAEGHGELYQVLSEFYRVDPLSW